MIINRITAGGIFALCFCAVLAVPAMAASPGAASGHSVNTEILDNLEKQGYDVSEIRSALDKGDSVTAEDLMQKVGTTGSGVPSVIPSHGMNITEAQARMDQDPDRLSEGGYDVSGIRAALAKGDTATAGTLMQQFGTVHPEAFSTTDNRDGNSVAFEGNQNAVPDTPGQNSSAIPDIRTVLPKGDVTPDGNPVQNSGTAQLGIMNGNR